jgi:pimeloyl-ACP methyl ester carboxylesterase
MAIGDIGKYASVNGLEMYYEVHGTRYPLVMVHGGFGVIGMFEPLLPYLAETRQVIAVEMQAHGHTADIDRPFSFEFLADDIAALLADLELANADILGYSLGGGVALQIAIRHPKLVRKLVIVSAPYKSNGWYAEVLTGMRSFSTDVANTWIGSPMHQAYISVAPKPENWNILAEKTGQLLGQEYDWSADVATINSPTLIAIGDADSVRTAHAVEFFELLGGGKKDAGWDGSGISNARLAILPATTHYNILSSSLLASTLAQFLGESIPEGK